MNKKSFTGLFVTAIILLACLDAEADNRRQMHSVPFDVPVLSEAFADDGGYPYGSFKKGRYGERRNITTEDEAQIIMREYFPKKDFKIGRVKKKKFYFEADIIDKEGKMIDRVIIDRRTGRIRSAY